MSTEQSEHYFASQLFTSQVNRRSFLRLISLTALGATTGCLPQNLLKPIYEPIEIFTEKEEEGLKLFINQNGLPIKYLLPNKQEVYINQQTAKEVRQKAIDIQEPEVLSYISFPEEKIQSPGYFKPTTEHPLISKLPQDTLSKEELQKRGVKIIQGEYTSLFLRKNVFNPGELLENNTIGSLRKLIIALVDGPRLSKLFVKDKKYDEIRPLFEYLPVPAEDIETLRARNIQVHNESLEEDRKTFHKTVAENPQDEEGIMFFKHILLMDKANIAARRNSINDYQFLIYEAPIGGYFAANYLPQIPDTEVIMLAVGKIPPREEIVIYFDDKGECMLFNFRAFSRKGYTEYNVPHLTDTHPKPPMFKRGNTNKEYIFTPDSVGFQLRHELAHYQNPKATQSEADIMAAKSIKRAWDRWEQSGFTDDQDEYLVFKNENDEGYILN